jgi:uncharacterized membrane protein YgcG
VQPEVSVQALSDESGELLARAVRDHEPTADEIRRVAAYWAFVVVASQTGQLDPSFMALDLYDPLPHAATRYPSLFSGECTSTAHSPSTAQIRLLQTGTPSFTCNTSCTQSYPERAQVMQEIVEQVAGLGLGALPTFKAAEIVTAITDAVVSRPGNIASVLAASVPDSTASDFVQVMGELICGAGSVAGAAVLLGATAPALPVIAATGAVVGAGMTAVQLHTRFVSLAEHYGACTGWKLVNCEEYSESTDPCVRGFACQDGTCVTSGTVCGGADDCADGSDEFPELCSTPENCCAVTHGCSECCCGGSNCCDDGADPGAAGSDGMGGEANGGNDSGGAGGASGSGGEAAGGPGGGSSGGNAGSPPVGDPDAGPMEDPCCDCVFDVYCTEFGQGGCWYCTESQIDADGNCMSAQGLAAPGACMCDPELYQVCQ